MHDHDPNCQVMNHRIGALVLAAGFGRRYGGGKLAATMADGRRLIEHSLANITAAIDEVVIVSRPGAIEQWLPGTLPLLLFEDAGQGMGASLAFGVSRLPPWDGCLVCLADMPFIEPQTYRQLAAKLTPQTIVIPRHQQACGNPVGFGRDFFPELARLRNDSGGRQIIQRHQHAIHEIHTSDPAILIDIDTPEDLKMAIPKSIPKDTHAK